MLYWDKSIQDLRPFLAVLLMIYTLPPAHAPVCLVAPLASLASLTSLVPLVPLASLASLVPPVA